MSRSHTEKRRPAQTERSAAAPSETELQHQRADAEGMTRNKPQPQHRSKDEGEGRSDDAAEPAVGAIDDEEGEELRHAERLGKEGTRA